MPPEGPHPFGVEELRSRLARIDRVLVELLGVRVALATTIIGERHRLGEGLTNGDQERVVHDRARRWSRELGLPPELVERVFVALVAAGKTRYYDQAATARRAGRRMVSGTRPPIVRPGESSTAYRSDPSAGTGDSGPDSASDGSIAAGASASGPPLEIPIPVGRRRRADPGPPADDRVGTNPPRLYAPLAPGFAGGRAGRRSALPRVGTIGSPSPDPGAPIPRPTGPRGRASVRTSIEAARRDGSLDRSTGSQGPTD